MIDELRALRAAIEQKSLTGAANTLHLTQSAISRRIQQLEETLGGSLLDRANRPPTPTLLGDRVYQQSHSIIAAIDQLLLLASESTEPTGVLRLGVTHAIGDIIIAATASRLKKTFPLLDLRLRTAWSPELTKSLSYGELDAAVILLPSGGRPSDPIIGKHIASLDVVIVQSKSHPSLGHKADMSALADQGWILNPQGCGYRAEMERAIGVSGKNLRVVIDTYGTDIQLRMIASGLGIGLVPQSLLAASPARKDLSIVKTQGFKMSLEMWLAHPKELGNLRKAMDVFESAITAEMKALKNGAKKRTAV